MAKPLSANIKRYRLARGLSQSALADAVGISLQTVWNYENGVHLPQLETLDHLAKALNVRPWQLLAAEGEGGSIPPDVADRVADLARACGLKVSR